MRFTVRSLGGKFIVAATITLLLCVLLFSVIALGLLKYRFEREAKSDAVAHLQQAAKNYLGQSPTLIAELQQAADSRDVLALAARGSSTTVGLPPSLISLLSGPNPHFSGFEIRTVRGQVPLQLTALVTPKLHC